MWFKSLQTLGALSLDANLDTKTTQNSCTSTNMTLPAASREGRGSVLPAATAIIDG